MCGQKCVFIALFLGILQGCSSNPGSPPRMIAHQGGPEIGGRQTVTLSQPAPAGSASPRIVSVEILPGRGMNIFQIRAWLPGTGVIDLIASPSLDEARKQLSGDDFGNASFRFGGAILVPFANRIRGKLAAGGKTIETTVNGKPVSLPANWRGKNPAAEPHAMHGLVLDMPMDAVHLESDADHAGVTAQLDAGNFRDHWPSRTNLTISAILKLDSFGFTVTARNSGAEDLPIGIGWHPYFAFPSGRREQVRLKIPAKERALANNYDDVFPTGKLVSVGDLFANPLGNRYLDDCFVHLERNPDGAAIAEIIDPAGHYGLRVAGLSPEISAFQIYAPPDKAFVALEPQFNWADPFSPIWQGRDTGMKILKPGEAVTYSVRLEIFVP